MVGGGGHEQLYVTHPLVCDVIDFICDLKLFKAINRNYFDLADGLITIPRSINYGETLLWLNLVSI